MKLIFELSKEHKTLPSSEIIACLNSENLEYSIIKKNIDVMILNINSYLKNFEKIFNRLSLTYHVNKLLFFCSPSVKEIKKFAFENKVKEKGSIVIRYRRRSIDIDSQNIVKSLADIYTRNRKVDLINPDIEIRVLITDSEVYIGQKIIELNRSEFEKRKVQFRPYFSPISLHPKIARTLVNLSSIRKNEVLMDPFCGTGGILIEAGLLGMKVIGSDVEEKMIEGCKKNLEFYNIKNYDLFTSDISNISKRISSVDAVVTDFPYGKSTTTKGEDIIDLYERAFCSISNVLKKNSKAVIGLSNKDLISLGEKYLSLCEVHNFRAHSSLNRFFIVFKK